MRALNQKRMVEQLTSRLRNGVSQGAGEGRDAKEPNATGTNTTAGEAVTGGAGTSSAAYIGYIAHVG